MASCIPLLWAAGTREWKVLSSARSQAAILVLQETMSEKDRRLLLLRTSVLRLATGHSSSSRKRQSEPLGFPWPRGLPGSPALRSDRDLGLHLEHLGVQGWRGSSPGELCRALPGPGSRILPAQASKPPCAPAYGEQRLSKQQLVRQQIAQETFPNELEGLVPLPGAAALPACLARQRLAWRGPALRGEQSSSAGSGAAKACSAHLLSLPARASAERGDALTS